MKNLTYRVISKNDNLELAVLIRDIFIEFKADRHEGTIFTDPTTDNLFDLFQEPRSECWIVSVENRIIGCCGIYPTEGLPKKCAELVKFYLLKAYRGKGLGKALLNLSIQSAVKLGYEQLYLESLPEFDKAIKLYEKMGFKSLSKPMGNSGHFGCNIWMVKNLV